MKTKEELHSLKEELVALNNKLKELSREELKQVCGGNLYTEFCPNCGIRLEVEPTKSMGIYLHYCPQCGYKELY